MNPPAIRIEMLSQARLLSGVRGMMRNLMQRLGFDEAASGQVSLAVDEAICNVISHGYERRPDGAISISVWPMEDPAAPTASSAASARRGVKIVIEDRARQVDPRSIRSRDLADIRPGGLGVFIIREVMDEVTYEKREGGGMRLTMIKLRSDEADANECCADAAASAPPQPANIEDQQEDTRRLTTEARRHGERKKG